MKLSPRERLLVLLLPLTIVLAGYAWWFNMFQRPKMAKIQKDHAAASAAAIEPIALMEQRAALAQIRREVQALEDRRAAQRQEAGQLSGTRPDPLQTHQAAEELTAVFRRHRLKLIEEAPAGRGDAGRLPKALTDAVSRLGPAPPSGSEQVRSFKLSGRFLDLLAAVRELTDDDTPPGVPIGLSMDEVDSTWQSENRVWTLLVWM
ncbi:MAG: hypothetical protein KJ000_31585 [Pirellulaceae bacterium]|nr:hypothetical protein [Pirellulaceae bacterium]